MEIIFYKAVQHFIDSLDIKLKAKVDRHLQLLQKYNYLISMPLSRMVAKDLYELRILGSVNIRVFYTFHNDCIILLHAFIKKSQKIPQKEIKQAMKRLKYLTSI